MVTITHTAQPAPADAVACNPYAIPPDQRKRWMAVSTANGRE